MKKDRPEFLDYFVLDILGDDSRVSVKSMFGGYGIYLNRTIFSIYAFDKIYFRENENNKGDFDKYEAEYFVYEKKDGKQYKMRYRELPEEVMEGGEIWGWIEKAVKI